MRVVIVPAYNEAETIGSVIRSLFCHVDAVVVVDDGSIDNTAQIAFEAGAIVLRHCVNRGQGAALETGHAYARLINAQYVIHFDADGQFSVDDIEPALQAMIDKKVDVLFGSRYLDTRSNVPFIKKYLMRPIGLAIQRMVGGPKLTDVHNGFRILTRTALEQISITHDRMAHASELPKQVISLGLTYVEHPVQVRYSEFGQGVRGGLHIVKDLLIGKFVK